MRRNRLLLLAAWTGSLVGISFYGGQVTYGLFFLLTLLPLLSLLYLLGVLLCFKIYQETEGRDLTCGQPSVFHFVLQNESPLLFAGIRVVFYSSFSQIQGLSDRTEYELRPRSGIRKKTGLLCRYRGVYEVGIKEIVVQDYLRLFTIPWRNREPFKVNVRPAIVRLPSWESADTVLRAVKDHPERPSDPDVLVREYVPGDDPRQIHWNLSAAAGTFLVRKTVGEQPQGIAVLMDPQRYSRDPAHYLPLENKLLETVLAFALYATERGLPVDAFYLPDGLETSHMDPGGGFLEFYEKMSAYLFQTDRTFAQLVEEALIRGGLFQRSAVFFVTHAWTGHLAETVLRLSRGGIPVGIYLIGDGAPTELPQFPLTEIVHLTPDADLTEVL